jgi:hypothetical protein
MSTLSQEPAVSAVSCYRGLAGTTVHALAECCWQLLRNFLRYDLSSRMRVGQGRL